MSEEKNNMMLITFFKSLFVSPIVPICAACFSLGMGTMYFKGEIADLYQKVDTLTGVTNERLSRIQDDLTYLRDRVDHPDADNYERRHHGKNQ